MASFLIYSVDQKTLKKIDKNTIWLKRQWVVIMAANAFMPTWKAVVSPET
jgi:hypothetical protein